MRSTAHRQFLVLLAATLAHAGDAPPQPPPTVADVAYGMHERQVLDLWQAPSGQPTPVVFHIHGGGWVRGDKAADSITFTGRAGVIAGPKWQPSRSPVSTRSGSRSARKRRYAASESSPPVSIRSKIPPSLLSRKDARRSALTFVTGSWSET